MDVDFVKDLNLRGDLGNLAKLEAENILEVGRYEKNIDIDGIRRGYGDDIFKDPDNVLFAINNPCNILGEGTLKNILVKKVSASTCKLPVDSVDEVNLKRANISKNKADLIDSILSVNPNISTDIIGSLEYNHRIPISIAKQYPEAVANHLKNMGIDDINKYADLMNHSDNIKHYWSWRDHLKTYDNVDTEIIEKIIKEIEINGINRGIDYINDVYK